MSHIVIGVDGGGTRTRVIVADERGTELARLEGDGSAVSPGGSERSAAIIASMVADTLAATGVPDAIPSVLYAGVAGAGRESERHALWQALVARGLADEVVVCPDASIARDDAFGEGPGILLIAGTGSVAFGRGPTGVADRCGGWGPVCGDEGAGAWIGRRALSIVTAASDGREPDTALTGAVLTSTEVRTVDELVDWAAGASATRLASLAPAVLQCADSGDLRANTLVSIAAEELVLHVRTLARRLFVDERAAVAVALAGGLLERGSPLRSRVEHRLKSAVPGAQVESRQVVPVRGAIRAAIHRLTSREIAAR